MSNMLYKNYVSSTEILEEVTEEFSQKIYLDFELIIQLTNQ
jgi:hypothetical protein